MILHIIHRIIHIRFILVPLFSALCMHSYGQNFNTNGNASYLGGLCYELTADAVGQNGSIFSNNAIDLNEPFTFVASLNFGYKDPDGADGIVFILAPDPESLGGGGGGMGYGGISPSIAVEFDTYYNSNANDPLNDHMAITSNGIWIHAPPTNLSGPIELGNIETGQDYCFQATWDPNSQTLIAGLNGYNISYTGDIISTIFGGNPIVHYGFSSATGLAHNRHVVCVVPVLPEPMPDVTICQGETAYLQADLNGMDWTWQPDPTLSNTNISNPTADPVMTTTYIVGIDYFCNGIAYDTVTVTVNPDLSSNASNSGPECEGENIQLMAWGGESYSWSGPNGYSSNLPNPVLSGVTIGNSGTYSVTIYDDNACMYVATTEVEVYPTPVVNIVPPALPFCETGDPVQLTATPAGGTWEGEIGTDGVFNPVTAGVGDHVIEYYYTDGNNCSASTDIQLTVVPNTPAVITPPGPFCEDESQISLTADPPGGTWGGIANASGQIFPNMLSPGLYSVSYALTSPAACYDTEIQMEIVAVTTLVMPDLPDFCDDDADYQITGFDPPGGTWSGASTPDGMIEPQVLGPGSYQVTYTYTPAVCPVVSGSVLFSVFGSPEIQNIERICDATATTYTVQFEIIGGDPSGYIVEGTVTGDIQPGNPSIFLSDPIPTEASYSFSIFDGNHCDTVILSGIYSCDCVTAGGNMDQEPITACEGENITVNAASGYELDPNDIIVYVLHTGNPFEYIVIGEGTTFIFEPPVETGITYFVAALIGNETAGGGIDLTDPCLAIMPGPSLTWQANPTAQFEAPTDICAGDGAVLTFIMTGTGPFDITYLENNTPFEITGISSPYTITVYPEFNTSYTFSTVTDLAGNMCSSEVDITIDIAVGDAVVIEAEYTICQGDSIFLEGAYQTSPGVYYDTFPGNFTCDTFIESTLFVSSGDTTYASGTTCNAEEAGIFENTYVNIYGCDSLVIETVSLVAGDTTYQFDTTCDPSAAGTFMDTYTGADGCDSTVFTEVTLASGDTTHLSGTSCNSTEIGNFTESFTGSNGCDSIVITTITYSAGDTTYLNNTTCDEQQTGVFVDTYVAQNGCDSVVILTITLTTADTTYLTGTTCDEQQAGVFSDTYVAQNGCDSVVISTINLTSADTTYLTSATCDQQQTGVFTDMYTGQNGCDSVVISTITLTTADTTFTTGTTCDAQQTGVFTDTYIAQNGCDSVVIATITLTTSDTTYVSGTTCDIQQVGVFTDNYTGQNGCDSIVISTISLTTADTSYLAGTTCDAQQTGVFIEAFTGQNGCDSIVISTITLTTSDTTYISGTTCDAQQVGIQTFTYTAQNGCDSTVVSNISLTTPDTIHISGTSCNVQQVGVFTASYTAQNGCDSTIITTITYALADTSYITATTCDATQAGVFSSTYLDQNGCDSLVVETIVFEGIDTMRIQRFSCMPEDSGIVIQTFQTMHGCDSVILTQTDWDLPDTVIFAQGTCLPGDTGTYIQQLENINGCDSTILTIITLLPEQECGFTINGKEIYAPNIFSPDHDGINDQFYIMADAGKVSGIKWFRIYDRWGGAVMEKENGLPNDPAFGWDGTKGNQLLNPGVFIWQAQITYANGVEKILSGDVMLVR